MIHSDVKHDTLPLHTPPKKRWRRMMFTLGMIALLVVALWLIGDFAYSRITLAQLDRYEQSLSWDANGLRRGEGEFEMGAGHTALLLVHGINFSPIAFRNFGPELAKHGFKCRAMRLPGFAGRVRDYADFKYPEWIIAIDREVQTLAAEHDRVVVVAHSLGAAVVLRYLLERQPKIAGVVLIAPAIEVSNARSPVFSTRFWHEFSNRTLWFTSIVLSPFDYDVHDPEVIRTIPQKQFTPRAIVDQTFALIDQNRGQASQMDVPLLMILSPSDQVIDTPAAEAYFNDWGTEKKTLLLQTRAGHLIPLDYGWQDAVSAIVQFVDHKTSDKFSPAKP